MSAKTLKEGGCVVSDDIVTRLRNKRTEFDNWLNDIEGKHSFGHDESIWLDAADEIERLRAAIRHLYFNEGVCYGENCEQCELVFGLCDDKAVRGDR